MSRSIAPPARSRAPPLLSCPMKPPPQPSTKAGRASWARAAAALVIAAVILAFGGVPGSVMLRALVVERAPPLLPRDTRDRDAALEVSTRDETGRAIASATVHVF